MTAFEFGQWAARENDPFCPEFVFASDAQMGMYAQGFLSVKPDNQAALSFIGQTFYSRIAELRAADLYVDEAQYTPRPGYDF